MLRLLILFMMQTTNFACGKQSAPAFVEPLMDNVTAIKGQDVEFRCRISRLGKHMVAFVRADTPPRLLTFDERVFRQRDKYEIRPRTRDDEWILVVKNVQENDAGGYSCQLNTDPVLSRTGYLHLKVPPYVARTTASAVEVREGHNVTLSCRAFGDPPPTVVWRRHDRQIIRFNGATGYGASVFNGSDLTITKVSRKHMSEYVCVASNGVPPDESWTVKLHVTFEPLVVPQAEIVQVALGGQVSLVCNAEAWPRPTVTWEKDGHEIFDSAKYYTSHQVSEKYRSVHILTIKNASRNEFGTYRCTAVNDNGEHYADIFLKEGNLAYANSAALLTEGSGRPDDDDDDEDDDGSNDGDDNDDNSIDNSDNDNNRPIKVSYKQQNTSAGESENLYHRPDPEKSPPLHSALKPSDIINNIPTYKEYIHRKGTLVVDDDDDIDDENGTNNVNDELAKAHTSAAGKNWRHSSSPASLLLYCCSICLPLLLPRFMLTRYLL